MSERRLNPMKLIDAATDKMSSAVRSTVKGIKEGPSVADRISGLLKNEDEAKADTDGKGGSGGGLDTYRIKVDVGDLKNDVNASSYKITLFEKKANTLIYQVVRPWRTIENTLSVVRSMCPKMEVPSAPSIQGRVAAVAAEERRKFIQTFVNTAVGHASASKVKELRETVGIKDYEEGKLHDARMMREPSETSRLRHLHGSPNSDQGSADHGSFAGSFGSGRTRARRSSVFHPNKDEDETASNSSPFGSRIETRRSASERRVQINESQSTTSPEEDRQLIEACFKVLDADGIGRITRDEMGNLFEALDKHVSSNIQNVCLDECDKDNGAFDKKSFHQVILRISAKSKVPVTKLMGSFKDIKFSHLYEVIGNGGKSDEHEEKELKTLVFILRVSGIRLLTEKEVEKTDITIPVSLPDFCELMDALTAVIQFDEVLKALGRGRDKTKLLQLVNKHATRANPSLVRALRDKITRSGGGGTTARCANCDQTNKEKVALQEKVKQLTTDNESLLKKVETLTTSLKERDDRIRDMSDSTTTKAGIVSEINKKVEELERQLAEAREEKDALLTRLCDTEAELEIQQNRSSAWTSNNSDDDQADLSDDDNGLGSGNMYFLAPLHLGSSDRAPVVDLPGALVYELPPSFFPLGITMDIFLRTEGTEYLAIRDKNGSRSCAWTIENSMLSCPWAKHDAVRLPKGKWVRLVCRFHWTTKVFDIVLDDETVMEKVPMRDHEHVDGVATLDVFPRTDVVLCYANMHFFR